MLEGLLTQKANVKPPPGELPLGVSTRIDTFVNATAVGINYDGTRCLIGAAAFANAVTDTGPGFVAIYRLEYGAFKRLQTIRSPEVGQNFGSCATMSVNGDYIAVGNANGRTFIYKYNDDKDEYEYVQTLVVNAVGTGNMLRLYFTRDSGDLIVANYSSVFHYIRNGEQFDLVGTVATGDRVGSSISATDDKGLLVIGSPFTNTSGEIVLYRRINDAYVQLRRLTPATIDSGDWYGWGSCISGDGTAIIGGMPYESKISNGGGGVFGWTVDPVTYATTRGFTSVGSSLRAYLGYATLLGETSKRALVASPGINSTSGGIVSMGNFAPSSFFGSYTVRTSATAGDNIGAVCAMSHNGLVGIASGIKTGVFVLRRYE